MKLSKLFLSSNFVLSGDVMSIAADDPLASILKEGGLLLEDVFLDGGGF